MYFQELAFTRNDCVDTEYLCCQHSRYIEYFRRYLKYFKREQIHVVDGDALTKNPLPELRKVESFLGLEHEIIEEQVYFNESRGFYCAKNYLGSFCLGSGKGRTHPEVDEKNIRKLRDYFRPFNREFANAVGQNFSWYI